MSLSNLLFDRSGRGKPYRRRSLRTELDQLSRGVARAVLTVTRDTEYACDEVFELLDRYVEMQEAGENPRGLHPLVYLHLSMCRDCQEEFAALVRALRAAR